MQTKIFFFLPGEKWFCKSDFEEAFFGTLSKTNAILPHHL